MPSDHAVLFFSLAVGIFLIHRLAGTLLLVHAVVVISLPRVYMGVHFPGDIVVGALVGTLLALTLFQPFVRALQQLRWERVFKTHPGVFYPMMFLITFQGASMFGSARELAGAVVTVLEGLFGA